MIGLLSLTTLVATVAITAPPATAGDDDSPAIFLAQADDDEDDKSKSDDDDYGGDIDLGDFRDALEPGEEEDVQRMQQEDALDSDESEEQQLDDLDFGDDQEEVFDFSDDAESVPIGGPGQDTARIYRTYKEGIEDLGPDEEIIQWERYLQQYPNSLFKDHIQRRIDELTEFQYSERVPGAEGFEGIVDAGRREIKLALPRHLDSVDPRSKIRGGFEWGYPQFMGLQADYEHQIARQLSAHAGIVGRYEGFNIELGGKYALVKSARTNFLLTGLFDIHMNVGPVYPAFRPQIGAGKRFIVGGNPLDLQAVVGVDAQIRDDFSLVYLGGLNASYQASEKVSFFFEGTFTGKDMFWDSGKNSTFFRFPVLTFGISFWADKNNKALAALAANAPIGNAYWGYHFGGVQGDFAYYLR
ncbi:MAG: hypothetical protein ABIO70_20795 [Pseudomonadota bacterium]